MEGGKEDDCSRKDLGRRLPQIQEWKDLPDSIMAARTEICGLTSGKRGKERETRWWSEGVQQKLKEKRVA